MRRSSKIAAALLVVLAAFGSARVVEAGGHVVRPAWILETKLTHCSPWEIDGVYFSQQEALVYASNLNPAVIKGQIDDYRLRYVAQYVCVYPSGYSTYSPTCHLPAIQLHVGAGYHGGCNTGKSTTVHKSNGWSNPGGKMLGGNFTNFQGKSGSSGATAQSQKSGSSNGVRSFISGFSFGKR